LRIAIIAPPWVPVPPPAYGGTEAVVDNLARGLQAAGHQVLLFSTGDSSCAVPTDWVVPSAVGTVGMGSPTEARHVINAYQAALAWDADVVHDHTLIGPIYGERFGLPIITTNHGPFESELRDFYEAIGSSIAIIAISHRQAAAAGDIPVAAVIHHGLDVDGFPLGTGDGNYALFLGRMSPDKGVHTAVQIARKAEIPLKIAAKLREPAERAYFEEAVEPFLGDGIDFVGEVGGQTKLDLLARARCLLNPIAWPEPFGMVMIEALACGTPVLATPCGAVPEIVDDGLTGFVREEEADLAEVVLDVGTLDRRLCRDVAAERFSTERMAADHVRLYQSLLAGPGLRGQRDPGASGDS
jgi:glycosyltransferase involved in cell wall biosynthesis